MIRRRFDRCAHCHHQVLWVTRVRPGQPDKRVCLDPREINPSGHEPALAAVAVVVNGIRAYSPTDLAEIVMDSRRIALQDAFDAIRTDFPWHHYHACEPSQEDSD